MQPDAAFRSDSRASGLHQAVALLVPTVLGMGLIALIGFVPYPAVHDAFHDVRHTAGFPCH